MEQYISKAAVLAELERRKSQFISQAESFREIGRKEQENYFAALASNMNSLSCFINTLEVIEVGFDLGGPNGDKSSEYIVDTKNLEVKEVDLEKEINNVGMAMTNHNPSWKEVKCFAKHFFELGLKAQKGE